MTGINNSGAAAGLPKPQSWHRRRWGKLSPGNWTREWPNLCLEQPLGLFAVTATTLSWKVGILQTLTVAFNHPKAQVDFGKKLLEISPAHPWWQHRDLLPHHLRSPGLKVNQEPVWTQKIQCNLWNLIRIILQKCRERRTAHSEAQHGWVFCQTKKKSSFFHSHQSFKNIRVRLLVQLTTAQRWHKLVPQLSSCLILYCSGFSYT